MLWKIVTLSPLCLQENLGALHIFILTSTKERVLKTEVLKLITMSDFFFTFICYKLYICSVIDWLHCWINHTAQTFT